MATTTQNTYDRISTADAHAQGIDGGLNLKADPTRLQPPNTTRSDNGWYQQPGNVNQLPAFASVMPANTSHIYNVHARDLGAPSSNGDIMVHGEVRDAPASTTNLFTSSLWSDANGTALNTQQPMPPFQLRTRTLTSQTNIQTLLCDKANPMFMREEVPTGQRRYGLAYYDGSKLNISYGLCDGMTETGGVQSYSITADYIDCSGVLNSDQWCAAYVSGTTLNVITGDFSGTSGITTAAPFNTVFPTNGYTASSSIQYVQNVQMLNHNGRTYVVFLNSGNAPGPYSVYMYDVLTKQTYPLYIGPTKPAGLFTVASANPTTSTTATTFLSVTWNGAVYVVARVSDTSAGILVTSALTLSANPWPAVGTQTGGIASFQNLQCTSIITPFDSSGGTGGGTQFGITIFRHQGDQPNSVSTGTAYQAVYADTFSFKANASPTLIGTLTLLTSNAFRTPAGAALSCKAFNANPAESGYAGLTAAKSSFVLVRSGGWEPNPFYSGNNGVPSQPSSFSQPTYFIIDHQARVVGRALELLAPAGAQDAIASTVNTSANTGRGYPYAAQFPLAYSLGSPLFSKGSPNDLSLLDITLPAWALSNQQAGAPYSYNGMVYAAQAPTAVVYQLTGICLSLSASVAGVPPIQAAAYSIFSGMLTTMHDGRGISEANFHFAAMNPINATPTLITTGSGLGPQGTYYYTHIFEYIDALGHVHRSQPATPWTISVKSGSFGGVTVELPLPVSAKSAVGGTLRVKLYRSLVNNTDKNYYLVATQSCSAVSANNYSIIVGEGTYYDPTTFGTGIFGAQSVAAQARLYTSLNATTANYTYLSTPPPSFIWQVAAKGRAFGLAQILGQFRLYYSSVSNGQYPFEWNTTNYANVPTELGDVRSLEYLDDKIVLLGTRTNAVMNGDGPDSANATGVPVPNYGFSLVQPVPTPAGVIGTGSPVRVPTGVMFQGYGGIQTVGRDTAITASGAQVDLLTGRQINNPGQIYGRAVMLPTLQSVVWANASGPALVYNYVTEKWSTWPLLSNVACMTQRMDGSIVAAIQPVVGSQYASAATATVPGADLGVLGANYAPVCLTQDASPGLVVETPWILPSGESAGEGQVWEVAITGSYYGPHILQVEQAYNYGTAYQSLKQFTVNTVPLKYQFRVRPSAGTRLWAIRYRVSVLPISALSSGYQMAALSDIVLFSGTQQGTTRLGASTSG